MASLIIDEPVDLRHASAAGRGRKTDRSSAVDQHSENLADLGIWLSGLESFLSSHGSSLKTTDARTAAAKVQKDLEMIHSTLQRCSILSAIELGRAHENAAAGAALELRGLRRAMIDSLEVCNAGVNAKPTTDHKLSDQILERLRRERAFRSLIAFAEREGAHFLPEPLLSAAQNAGHSSDELAEIAFLLPSFGRILRWLDVVRRMLEADEPLKPALVIFARINEQILDLTQSIDRRLKKFPDQDAEIFAKLDAAAYTASIELKKVFSQELATVAGLRPPPSVYARFETAHSLLNDGFQQMLAGLALEFDPKSDVYEMFPGFQDKQQHSLALRDRLWKLTNSVQTAERAPDKKTVAAMRSELRDFTESTVGFLFYKDTEAFERFVEEVFAARDNSDLVPILHRFGAYLETLFGQVSLRFVLHDHPFENK